MNKQLSKNFSHNSMFVSSRYPNLARQAKYARPSHIDKFLYLLSYLILQPSRDFAKCPIHVTSGYRDKALNDTIPGSSDSSLHMQGMAADIATDDPKLLHFIFDFIKEDLKGRFGEVFLYVFEDGTPRNIHVALPKWGKPPVSKMITIKKEQ